MIVQAYFYFLVNGLHLVLHHIVLGVIVIYMLREISVVAYREYI